MADGNAPSQSRGLSDDGARESGVAVETVTLATLLEREGLDRVELLKMDIEGAEHEVFLSTSDDILRRLGPSPRNIIPTIPRHPCSTGSTKPASGPSRTSAPLPTRMKGWPCSAKLDRMSISSKVPLLVVAPPIDEGLYA